MATTRGRLLTKTTCTLLLWGQHPTRAANARSVVRSCTSKPLRTADFSALPLKWLTKGPRTPTPEGSQPGFPWGHTTPIRPITGRHSLAPSSFTRSPISWPCGSLTLAGRLRAYHVPSLSPCGLGRAFSPVVRHLRRETTQFSDLTTCLLAQAYQQLTLVRRDGVYQRFTWVDHTTPSWLPIPCC